MLSDAWAIFEVLSNDTATTDRIGKLLEYATLLSLHFYVLLQQTAVAATLFQRQLGGPWIASAHTGGSLSPGAFELSLSWMDDPYRGLTFPGASPSPSE